MSKIYNVFISSGNSPGPYTVYYDTISSNNIATMYPTITVLASGRTLTELQIGITVEIPDYATTIIVYNEVCQTYKTFETEPTLKEYPCLCFRITYTNPLDELTNEKYTFCYNYLTINGKPQYENDNCRYLTWMEDHWEFEGLTGTYRIRSYYNSDIPDTNWFMEGFGAPNSIISVTQGDCKEGVDDYYIVIKTYNPTCIGQNDGSLLATAYGGAGGWNYSLDGYNYSNVNLFNGMTDGFYTVYAKDLSGNVVSQFFTLTGESNQTYYINGITSITNLSTINGMNYYQLTVNYNTSMIPAGESVKFDWKLIYNLFYQGPGSASFDTSQQFLTLNGSGLTINNVSSTPFTQNSVSPCNPLYYSYVATDTYSSTGIILKNTDVFTATINYGIDTETSGNFTYPCYTSASVGVNLSFENVVESCNCCELNNNEINVLETVQNYQP